MICHDLYIALGADPTSLTNPLQSITSRSCGPNFVAHSERPRVERPRVEDSERPRVERPRVMPEPSVGTSRQRVQLQFQYRGVTLTFRPTVETRQTALDHKSFFEALPQVQEKNWSADSCQDYLTMLQDFVSNAQPPLQPDLHLQRRDYRGNNQHLRRPPNAHHEVFWAIAFDLLLREAADKNFSGETIHDMKVNLRPYLPGIEWSLPVASVCSQCHRFFVGAGGVCEKCTVVLTQLPPTNLVASPQSSSASFEITYKGELRRRQSSELSVQSCGQVHAAIVFLQNTEAFKREIWSVGDFELLWRALFISYAPELRRPDDLDMVRRSVTCEQKYNHKPNWRIRGKTSVASVEDCEDDLVEHFSTGMKFCPADVKTVRVRICGSKVAPEDLFGVLFHFESALAYDTEARCWNEGSEPKYRPCEIDPLPFPFWRRSGSKRRPCDRDLLTLSTTDFQRYASGPSPLRMECIKYAGDMYYCLRCRDWNDTWEDWVLPDLQDEDRFLSQGWSAADFEIMWGWVQKAQGHVGLGYCGDRGEWSPDVLEFTFDVDTKDGRLVKRDVFAGDAVVCGEAHVRLKTMEKAGESVAKELQLLRQFDPSDWENIRQLRATPPEEWSLLQWQIINTETDPEDLMRAMQSCLYEAATKEDVGMAK